MIRAGLKGQSERLMDGGSQDETQGNGKEGRSDVRNGWTGRIGEEKEGREDRSNDRVRDGRFDGAAAFLALSFHDGWRVFSPPILCVMSDCALRSCV